MKIGQRILLIVLLTWALIMIVPDLWRAAWPLASYGLQVDNEGNVYDVVGQFDREADSPAWQAGIRVGDRLDLDYLECLPYSAKRCGRALSILGGRQLVLPGSSIRLHLLPDADTPERVVTLVAAPEPANPFERFVVGLDQIAGILVVVAAAWLVWTRPGAMSWGFFLYVMWFNPGQVYAYYAMLAESTPLLIAQNVAESFAEATGYAGLILFVLRAPNNKPDPRWRWLERSLPLFALALAIGLLFTYGRFFDFRSEAATRVGILTGFVVAICAVGILLERLRRLPPVDYQRLRWVFWGCLIGLPAFTLAELASSTTIFETRWGDFTPTDDVIGLLYLVNGILPVRLPGDPAGAGGERRRPAPARDHPRPHSEHPRADPASLGRAYAGASRHSELGLARAWRGRALPHLAAARARHLRDRPLFQSRSRPHGEARWCRDPEGPRSR
jgi:hypothetical protein